MNRHCLHIPVKRMTKVGVLHENVRILRRFWRKLISLMLIWANYNVYIMYVLSCVNVLAIKQQQTVRDIDYSRVYQNRRKPIGGPLRCFLTLLVLLNQ